MIFEELANVVLKGPFSKKKVSFRLQQVLNHRKLPISLANRLVDKLGEGTRPSFRAVVIFLKNDRKLLKKLEKGKLRYDQDSEGNIVTEMAPDRRISVGWQVPSILNLGELCDEFNIRVKELDWLAAVYGSQKEGAGSKLAHYHLVMIPKKGGGERVLEVPKWRLKEVQRSILKRILYMIPSHRHSHGFKREHSIMTYVRPHVGKGVVIKFDLKDYFLTVNQARVRSLFHLAGYPPKISYYLARLCTHCSRLDRDHKDARKYREYHLPQGAPTSPAIANLLLYKVDVRLSALADKMGMSYTRYADDMAFSLERISNNQVVRFKELVCQIVTEEGWVLNHDKTRVMSGSQCQRLGGLVINSRVNVCRKEYDTLKAIIHRVKQNGLEEENHEAHPHFAEYLRGRVAYVKATNIARGEKLESMMGEI